MARRRKKQSRRPAQKKRRAQEKRPAPQSAEQAPAAVPAEQLEEPQAVAAPAAGSERQEGLPVVGVGASAGGLDALKRFLTAMPGDTGIAFVLIPHLDPTHQSLMVELLGRHTPMPVVEAKEGMPVQANRVYIIPPNKYMTISGGVLRLTGPVERRGLTTIDLFLRSLAQDQQEKAICVIMTGTGASGTLGLKAVKANGGMAMVQDPKTAEYDRMPQSAIATGLADYILPVEGMPEALVKYVQHFCVNGRKPTLEEPDVSDLLTRVLALLQARTKFDFRCYRKAMLLRRVQRRMGLNHVDQMGTYFEFLRAHPEEVRQLAKDLLISVTSFFRDPEAFRALETQVIEPLVRSKEADEPLRVWVPSCATGEEAYSLAILLLEQLAAQQKNCRLQIFATEVDEKALEVARQGIYPESIAADIAQERLARYFTIVDEQNYQVSKPLREGVTFAAQNLIGDAPFTKLDLISCRNVLIYLEPEVQKKVISLLHFSLNQGGYLFLGPSETIGRQVDLFEPVSKKWRIYRRIGSHRPEHVDFPIVPARQPRSPLKHLAEPAATRPVSLAELTQHILLAEFAPAAVLINRKCEVLYFFGPTSNYLELPTGEPTQELMMMAREGLRTKLRAAIHKAIRDAAPVVVTDVHVKRNGGYCPVKMTVKTVQAPKTAEGLLLITFAEMPALPSAPSAQPAPVETAADELAVHQLEFELKATREDLQSTIEEMESSNEELKAANEEVMSMNEELQSANEELETSKEELQSLNEELNTVNNELREKVDELDAANSDMANLLNCTDIGTVFLDQALRIKRFTPAAVNVFNLIASDLGRPIGDITSKLSDGDLLRDAEHVLRHFRPREKEIQTAGGWYLRRITPYRTSAKRIEGVVITCVDISQWKRAERALGESEQRARAVFENAAVGLSQISLEGRYLDVNPQLCQMLGYEREEMMQLSVAQVTHPDDLAAEASLLRSLLEGHLSAYVIEKRYLSKRGEPLWVRVTSSLAGSSKDRYRVSVIEDIASLRRSEVDLKHLNESLEYQVAERTRDVRDREARLTAILNSPDDAIITIDQRGIIESVNRAAERMFGYTAADMLGQNVTLLMPPPYDEEHDGYLANYRRTGIKKIIGISREVMARRKDGTDFPVDLAVSEIPHLKMFTGILRDITERKRLEREVLEIAALEQRRIGQDLHDSVGQELTALRMLAGDLVESLKEESSKQTDLAGQISDALQRTLLAVRTINRGLIPVQVDSEGLMSALADLAERTHKQSKVACTFRCPEPVPIEDNVTATHLYLIAQEAVTNALKHGNPKNIGISLETKGKLVILRIQDDGVGLPAQLSARKGLGLYIMRNRAGLIGARLITHPVEPSGTLVTCVLTGDKP